MNFFGLSSITAEKVENAVNYFYTQVKDNYRQIAHSYRKFPTLIGTSNPLVFCPQRNEEKQLWFKAIMVESCFTRLN